jgi:hypothetical protein
MVTKRHLKDKGQSAVTMSSRKNTTLTLAQQPEQRL